MPAYYEFCKLEINLFESLKASKFESFEKNQRIFEKIAGIYHRFKMAAGQSFEVFNFIGPLFCHHFLVIDRDLRFLPKVFDFYAPSNNALLDGVI